MKLRKLNIKGSSHLIALLAVVVIAGVGGTWALVGSHAQTPPYLTCGISSSPTPATGKTITVTYSVKNTGGTTATGVKTFLIENYKGLSGSAESKMSGAFSIAAGSTHKSSVSLTLAKNEGSTHPAKSVTAELAFGSTNVQIPSDINQNNCVKTWSL